MNSMIISAALVELQRPRNRQPSHNTPVIQDFHRSILQLGDGFQVLDRLKKIGKNSVYLNSFTTKTLDQQYSAERSRKAN